MLVDNVGDLVIDSGGRVRDSVTGRLVEVGGTDTVNSSISDTLAQSLDSLNLVGTKPLTDKTITITTIPITITKRGGIRQAFSAQSRQRLPAPPCEA